MNEPKAEDFNRTIIDLTTKSDEWKRQECGTCEFRVTRDRDPRLNVPGMPDDDRGWCRNNSIGLIALKAPDGPLAFGFGYPIVHEKDFACRHWEKAPQRPALPPKPQLTLPGKPTLIRPS